jgi:segregation and condensation protein A
LGYHVKLEIFEGPFDLLLHLIEKAEVDIYSIPIAQITDQYLDYLERMKKVDLEVTSEFLIMAATLIKLKSAALLPKTEKEDNNGLQDDEDNALKENLIAKLVEYKYFKEIARILKEKEAEASLVYYRPYQEIHKRDVDLSNVLNNITLKQLWDSFKLVMEKSRELKEKEEIKLLKEEITIDQRMNEILNLLIKNKQKKVSFSQLFSLYRTKIQTIITFLALLELIRQNKVSAFQASGFGEIYLSLKLFQPKEDKNK